MPEALESRDLLSTGPRFRPALVTLLPGQSGNGGNYWAGGDSRRNDFLVSGEGRGWITLQGKGTAGVTRPVFISLEEADRPVRICLFTRKVDRDVKLRFTPAACVNGDPDRLAIRALEHREGGASIVRVLCTPKRPAPPVVVPPVVVIVLPPPLPPPAPLSDLHLVKIADRTTAQTGDTVTFTLTVRNDGPNSATSVLVNDPLTAGFVYLGSSASVGAYNASTGRWTLGDLANGATGALTITARVTAVGSLTNTATASSSVGDPDPADNTSSVVITGTSPPPPPPAASANLRITKQASDTTVSIGETETYTVTVSNNGPDAATSVIVSDQLPSGFSFLSSNTSVGAYNATTGTWTLGSLANGASATLTIIGTIASTGTITNTASVTSAVGDPDTADNTAGATVTSYALTQLSANGLFYLVNTPGSGVPVADISVGIGPVTLSRMTITLGTGLWTNVTNLALKVQGALPSDPRLGSSYTIDPTGTILTVDVINFSLTTASEIFRLTADVGAGAVPLQVTSVRAYGHQ